MSEYLDFTGYLLIQTGYTDILFNEDHIDGFIQFVEEYDGDIIFYQDWHGTKWATKKEIEEDVDIQELLAYKSNGSLTTPRFCVYLNNFDISKLKESLEEMKYCEIYDTDETLEIKLKSKIPAMFIKFDTEAG